MVIDNMGQGFTSVSSNSGLTIVPTKLASNSTHWLGFLKFNVAYGQGNISLLVINSMFIVAQVEFTSYVCEMTPYPLSFKVPSNGFMCGSTGEPLCSIVLNVNYTKPLPLLVHSTSPYICSMTPFKMNYYSFICKIQQSLSITPNSSSISNIELSLQDPLGRNSNFTIPTFLKYDNNKPPQLNPVYTFSSLGNRDHFSTIFTSNLNSGLFIVDELVVRGVQFLYGKPGEKTYIYNMYNQAITSSTVSMTWVNYISNTVNLFYNQSYTVYSNNNLPLPLLTNPTFNGFLNFDSINLINSSSNVLKYGASIFSSNYEFPYGVVSGNYQSNQQSIFFNVPQFSANFNPYNLGNQEIIGPMDNIPPVLESLEFIQLSKSIVVLRIKVTDSGSGFRDIKFDGLTFDYTGLVEGTIQNGYYEFILNQNSYLHYFSPSTYTITDFIGLSNTYNLYLGFNPIQQNPIHLNKDSFYNLEVNVTEFRWKFNDYDITKIGFHSTLYLGYTNANKDDNIIFYYFYQSSNPILVEAMWDEIKQIFSFDVFVPPGLPTGSLEYYLDTKYFQGYNTYYYSFIGPQSQLRFTSDWGDLMPPIFKDIKPYPSNNVTVQGNINNISWNLTISDNYAGFKSGFVIVTSDIDGLDYNFTLEWVEGKNKLEDIYTIEIPIPQCVPQTFTISYANLTDQFSNSNSDIQIAMDPFNFILSNQTSISIICPYSIIETIPPFITVTAYPDEINVCAGDYFRLYFETKDYQSTISRRHIPYCYVTGRLSQVHKTIATIDSVIFENQIQWLCNIKLPFGFGRDLDSLQISIYGFSNTALNYGGYATSLTITPKCTYDKPIIDSTSIITYKGGYLIIYGNNLYDPTDIDTNVTIVYNDSLSHTKRPSVMTSIALRVDDILPNMKSFYIYVKSNFMISNLFFVEVVQPVDIVPTSSPSPTIKPVSCQDNCGGPLNGKCIDNQCQCIDPWIGINCLSQVIIIDPVINNTNPTINHTLPNNGEEITLKSLISVVSLNEMKISGGTIISHPFNQWIYTNTTSLLNDNNILEYQYLTTINYKSVNFTVKVTLQYYKRLTTIEFAGENLQILPSSFKYKIEIKNYPFNSSLNYLQLAMSVSLQSSSTDSCSSLESGTSNDNSDSDYFKLQIDNNSLYGRFIKRGIVDNRIVRISNSLLTNPKSSSSNEQDLLIAIHIPYFIQNAIIDPDFSVLIDSKPAKDNENAICSKIDNDNSLTKPQLAGIIIGAIAFASIIVISILYIFYKKRQEIKFLKKMNKISDLQNN